MYQRIRDLREDRDLLQKDVAAYLKCTQVCYSNYETGKRADPGAADSQPDGDRNAAQHQCFVQNTVADLPPARADGFQQAKLLRPLCHRDGEGIID